jgi:hypothetical protein
MRRIAVWKNKKIVSFAFCDNEDYQILSRYRWFLEKNGYAISALGRMHRVVLGLVPNDGKEVDHINRKKTDNRKSNLRLTAHQENCINRKQTGSGVSFRKERNKWRARVKRHGKEICIGHFSTKKEAMAYRISFLKKLESGQVEPKLLANITRLS